MALIYSHFFAPSVGGVATAVLSLASGLAGSRWADGALRFDVTADEWSLPSLDLTSLLWYSTIIEVHARKAIQISGDPEEDVFQNTTAVNRKSKATATTTWRPATN